MKLNLIFFLKFLKLKQKKNNLFLFSIKNQIIFLEKNLILNKKMKLKNFFLQKSFTTVKLFKFLKNKSRFLKNNCGFFFYNRFILDFLEFFFKNTILFNLKKGSNKILLKQISFRKFSIKYFKKNLKTSKQIIGVIYYSLLLKDSSIFVNFFKKILEKLNIKLHKKLFKGLKRLLKDFYKPLFNFFGVSGMFFNIKGKIGVSGNAKKRRYYFFFGRHSLTSRLVKIDLKFTPIWTFTGTLGFSFLIFF